ARPRRAGRADAGDDHLLADERIRLPARPVVVDRRPDHRARAAVRRPVPDHRGVGRTRQPALAPRRRMNTALEVRNLTVTYRTDAGVVRAVDDASFDVAAGERLGLVGESGSGKTTTMLALMRMLRPPGRCERGSAVVDGTDLL